MEEVHREGRCRSLFPQSFSQVFLHQVSIELRKQLPVRLSCSAPTSSRQVLPALPLPSLPFPTVSPRLNPKAGQNPTTLPRAVCVFVSKQLQSLPPPFPQGVRISHGSLKPYCFISDLDSTHTFPVATSDGKPPFMPLHTPDTGQQLTPRLTPRHASRPYVTIHSHPFHAAQHADATCCSSLPHWPCTLTADRLDNTEV